MKISQSSSSKNDFNGMKAGSKPRKFTQSDIPSFNEKIFSEFDKDKNNRLTK